MVAWTRPLDQWIKINTDGKALKNPGKIGAGGILRDHTGKILMVYTSPLGEGSSNQAEIGAAIFGMTCTFEQGYRKIFLEVGSLLTVNWILQE